MGQKAGTAPHSKMYLLICIRHLHNAADPPGWPHPCTSQPSSVQLRSSPVHEGRPVQFHSTILQDIT